MYLPQVSGNRHGGVDCHQDLRGKPGFYEGSEKGAQPREAKVVAACWYSMTVVDDAQLFSAAVVLIGVSFASPSAFYVAFWISLLLWKSILCSISNLNST